MAAKKEKGKQEKKKKPFNRYKMYSVSGDKLERKNKECPKCGKDSYLATHKDRLSCGKCGYVEKKDVGKPEPEKSEEKANSEPKEK